MRRDLLMAGVLVAAAWVSGRMEYLNAKNKYESMIRVSNSRTRQLVQLTSRVNFLRRQRDEAMSLHVADYSRRCVTCEQLSPCQTWQILHPVEPNIDFP